MTNETDETTETTGTIKRPEAAALRSFVLLTRKKRQMLQQMKELEARLELLDIQLRDYFAETGMLSIKVKGMQSTIYLRRQIWARHKEWATAGQVVDALVQNGMQEFVKQMYNVSTLSAHIRELERHYKDEIDRGEIKSIAEKLPPDLANVLNVEPNFSLVAMDTD